MTQHDNPTQPKKKGPTPFQEDWRGETISGRFLVYECADFIVYLDEDIDVYWQSVGGLKRADENRHNDILNRAATLECIPNDHHPDSIRINFKRMVAEGIVRSLENDYENAEEILVAANEYITRRNTEVARRWQLTTTLVLSIAVALAGLLVWAFRATLRQAWGDTAFYIILAGLAGAPGAALSIILRIGRVRTTSEAPRLLHITEATARIIAGSLSAFLVAAMVRIGILLPTLADSGHLHIAMVALAFIAGASERWVPSIVAAYEKVPTKKPEKTGEDT
jgi:hypothetical protein